MEITKRLKSMLCLALAVVTVVSCFAFTAFADEATQTEEQTSPDVLVIDYANKAFKGVVDKKDSAITEKTTKDGKSVAKIVPNPTGADSARQIMLDAYSLAGLGIDMTKYNYMTVEYYYDCASPKASGKMCVNMLPNKAPFTGAHRVYSREELVTGKWSVATFGFGSKISSAMKPEYDSPNLNQFHFYPFSEGATASSLTANDVMYIGSISFHVTNPAPPLDVTITFLKGGQGVEGKDISISAKEGQEITIPECTYTKADSEFKGWFIGSNTTKLYMPGDKYSVGDGDVSFSALWNTVQGYPDYVILNYIDYYNGIIDKKKYNDVTTVNEIIENDKGLSYVRISPNPAATTANTFGLDGWSYPSAHISLNEYKYLAMVYKFESEKGYDQLKPKFSIMKNGDVVTKTVHCFGTPFEYGKWAVSVADLSPQAEFVGSNPELKQMHIRPFDGLDITKMSANDTLEIALIAFFKEKPDDFKFHTSFINGYAGNLFKPDKTMTRAEAATIIQRLLASDASIKGKYESKFADVAKGQWYYDSIAYLENKGILSSYSGNFEPNKQITRAEFVELAYNMGLAKEDPSNKKTFSDVPVTHPRYNAIMAAASAGIVGGYADGTFLPDRTITRAQVVKVINGAMGKTIGVNSHMQKFIDTKSGYADVPSTHWAFCDIMEASYTHATVTEKGKTEEWVYAAIVEEDFAMDYSAGEAKVAELDKLTAERIAEIRNTASAVNVTGTKYYVSYKNGNDANDGKSPEKAWKTLEKVNTANLVKGDGVFFNRGEMWRGSLTGKAGVTYSAYGEGAKPIINRSPENAADESKWTLVEGTTNIWKYYKDVHDIGGLVCDNTEDITKGTVIEKLVAYLKDGVYYYDKECTKPIGSAAEYLNSSDRDLTCFNDQKSANVHNTVAPLYVRCDKGNPGKVFGSIELLYGGPSHQVSGQSGTHIDNLCILYGGRHGISIGTIKDFKVTNCEVGWIGGCIQSYGAVNTDPANPVRYGNGIQLYGGIDGFVIDNCYVYECYDAGITNQLQRGGTTSYIEENVFFTNNVIHDCCYNIEYFMGVADNNATRLLKNIEYSGNILRNAGYGWGRLNNSGASHIKGWNHYNQSENFVIKNNIMDRSLGSMMHIGVYNAAWLPIFENNVYIQNRDSEFVRFGVGSVIYPFDSDVVDVIERTVCDKGAQVYFLNPIK